MLHNWHTLQAPSSWGCSQVPEHTRQLNLSHTTDTHFKHPIPEAVPKSPNTHDSWSPTTDTHFNHQIPDAGLQPGNWHTLTLRTPLLVLLSNTTKFPSGWVSAIATGPLAVLWYVVLADTSPRIIFMDRWESIRGRAKTHRQSDTYKHSGQVGLIGLWSSRG